MLCNKRGQFDKAEAEFERLISLDYNRITTYAFYGSFMLQRGEQIRALDIFMKGINNGVVTSWKDKIEMEDIGDILVKMK